MFQVVQIHTIAAPPETYAPIYSPQGKISPIATGLVGLAAGALAGAGFVASRKFSSIRDDESVPGITPSHGLEGSQHKPDPGPDAGSSKHASGDKDPHDGPHEDSKNGPDNGPEASI